MTRQEKDGSWSFPAPADNGEAAHLYPGLTFADIALPSTSGGLINLRHLTGKSVAFIYPFMGRPGEPNPPGWDDIPGAHGSTPQALGYNDNIAAFLSEGVQIFGLSGQSQNQQLACSNRLALGFELLSDEGGDLREAMALPVFHDRAGATYLTRITLVIDGGTIQKVFYPVHPPPGDALAVLRFLECAAAT